MLLDATAPTPPVITVVPNDVPATGIVRERSVRVHKRIDSLGGYMKVLRSILWMLIFFAIFAALELSWHWYMSTALPAAASMRALYGWGARRSLEIGHSAPVPTLVDMFFPVFVLGVAAGFASRWVHWAFALGYAVVAAAEIRALLPYYDHLIGGTGYWGQSLPDTLLGAIPGYAFVLAPVAGFALGGRASISNELRKKGKLGGCQSGHDASAAGGESGAK